MSENIWFWWIRKAGETNKNRILRNINLPGNFKVDSIFIKKITLTTQNSIKYNFKSKKFFPKK
jgi:hypothetical protein